MEMKPWLGYLVYLADGVCTPSRVSVLPLFSNAVYQKEANFLKLVVKSVISLLPMKFLRFAVFCLPICSKAGYHFQGKF